MKNIQYVIYSFIAFLFLLLTACGTATDPAEMYKGQSGDQIYQGGENALRKHNYSEAVKRFEALDAQYPFGRYTEISQLHIIYAYYKKSDYLSAEAAADRFIHAYPSSQYIDYAYYMRGLSNYYQNMGFFERLFAVDFATRDLSQIKKSYTDFYTLATRYPDSQYAAAAQQYTIYLRNVLADHQLEVAQYYFTHRAYVASANRASLVVKHYEGAPAVPAALVMMVRSYHALHATDLENQTLQVIQLNYPNSIYLKQATGEVHMPHVVPVARQPEIKKIPDVTPPASASSMPSRPMVSSNGSRGVTSMTLADLAKSVGGSKIFSVTPGATQAAPVVLAEKTVSKQPQLQTNGLR